MGKALYRKYRSRGLDEIVGQEHITTTLKNALAAGKIAHAYLLTGPRGVGKTSIARILAHEINGLTYSEDPHFDIIEIDAASNNGVEDIRDLRDKIMAAPTSAPYKVFIIDEVHMLSKAAFNALLKTLEEPPAHVVFILATTESHKLPETIISRTQRYSFRPVPLAQVVTHLQTIAKQEHITIDEAALQLIAEHGEGSFRDSISLLDQASSISQHVTQGEVEKLLGRAPADHITALAASLAARDGAKAISTIHSLLQQGYEPTIIAIQLSAQLRQSLLEGNASGLQPHDTLALLRELLDVPPAHNSKALLEIIVLQWCTAPTQTRQNPPEVEEASPAKPNTHPIPTEPIPAPAEPPTPAVNQSPSPEPVSPPASNISNDSSATPQAKPAILEAPDTSATLAEPAPAAAEPVQDSAVPVTPASQPVDASELWHAVLEQLKKTHNTLYGIARMARPSLRDNTLVLELKFAFHKKRLSEPANAVIVTKLIDAVRGEPTRLECITVQSSDTPQPVTETVAAISNIFGGAELLES